MPASVVIQVLQSNGTPASLAVVQFYKHQCIWFICADYYEYAQMTDLYGKVSASLDPGEYLFRGLWRGLEGNARCTITAAGPGTVKQYGKLIVTVHKA